MVKMKVEPERVIAAIIAANPQLKLDYREIAKMYGQGAKYNTMEHKFRAWRKLAELLRASDGEGNALCQAQTTPRKTRTTTAGARKVGPGSKKKSAKASQVIAHVDDDDPEAFEEIPDIVELSGDDDSVVDARIKLENDLAGDILGIKSYHSSDEDVKHKIEDAEKRTSKRVKVEVDIDDAPAELPSIDFERETYIDSHKNGYDLSLTSATVATADTTENVLANLDTLVRDSGAHDSYYNDEA